jgi:hypothetical protein
MNRQSRCVHCRCRFVPHPRVKRQRFRSNARCQRARKARWQRDKMATDADYQANQRDARQAWQHSHPDYWRQYRLRRADYRERNRLLQSFPPALSQGMSDTRWFALRDGCLAPHRPRFRGVVVACSSLLASCENVPPARRHNMKIA